MPDDDFFSKRDYTPFELATSITAIKQYINAATPTNPIYMYDSDNTLVLTLAVQGYLNGGTLSLNDVTFPLSFDRGQSSF